MSLPRRMMAPIPEETSRVAHAAFPKGHQYMQMRDELGSIYTDEMFADLYPRDGQPAIRPWRLALITMMQFAENLTDRQAADAVRDRIAWKYALGLELEDAGFDFSVLSEFRQRLLAHEAGQRLLDEMLNLCRDKGWLKERGKQRTDSTHVVAAVHKLNQLELVHETLRYALNEVARVAPAWLKAQITAGWFDHYSERTSSYLLPKEDDKRQTWAERVGRDGIFLLERVYSADQLSWLSDLPAIEMLRQVWLQNYYQEMGRVCLRAKKDQPSTARRIASPYDPEARYCTKREISWVGYKLHLTETCDPDTPHLITQVETRPSTEPDNEPLEIIHRHLAEKDLLPASHLVDQGYTSVELLIDAQEQYGIDLVGPVPEDTSWQAKERAYDIRQFAIDWADQSVTCPQGKHSCSWTLAHTRSERPVVKVKFCLTDCKPCAQRPCCTRNHNEKRRTLTFLAPQSHFEAQQVARQRQQTPEFKQEHAARAGVEGTISQAAFSLSARRSRYRGMSKTHFQHLATSTAINVGRVIAWLNEVPRSATPTSHFARLAA